MSAVEVIAQSLHLGLNQVAPVMRHIFGAEVSDALEVLLAQEVEQATAAVVAAVRGMDADTLAELIGKDDSRVSFQPLGDGTYRVAGAIRRSAVTGRVIRDERTEP